MNDEQSARERQNDSNERSDRSGDGSMDDQEGEPGSSVRRSPPASSENNNSTGSKERSQDRQESGNNAGTHHAMSNVEILSLFAPPANRDVANELELLDMVDEDEQYEIVRSFAAKYIVPNLTGHGL